MRIDPIFNRSSKIHSAIKITKTDQNIKISLSKLTFIDLGENDKIAKSVHFDKIIR